MEVLAFATPYLASNMYLLVENGRGIIIDPYDGFTPQIEEKCGGIDYILLTHEHCDHISGVESLRERYGCPAVCSGVCSRRLGNPAQNLSRYQESYMFMQTGEPVPEDLPYLGEIITHGDEDFSGETELSWQGHKLVLRETPGHSPGSICILVDGNTLFSGDSLLPNGVAVTRFPGGSRRQYEQITLPYLQELPDETLVYPGHYGAFRLEEHSIRQKLEE